ncbi:tRNA (N(6)-L-threonylcarbamoyladenosine(37)-C(2))-methylthiotransferase MtaB [bacterium]|nr:tRNA (N(6)-L-threonylcarbamoyladenosine(37)-C(2))-methylthiotransferase MtaB [bacterium]
MVKKTVKFKTFGCKLNQAETAGLAQSFVEKGYTIARDDTPADVSVINTCTVTGRSSAKCRQSIRQILRDSPHTTIIVTGCYSQVAANEIAAIDGVDYIFGSQDKFFLLDNFVGPGKLDRAEIHVSAMEDLDSAISNVGEFQSQTRAYLKIQDGCEHNCAYCIVPVTRGPCRSVSELEVVDQAGKLIDSGFKEIVLTGVHVGDYGKERHGRTELTALIHKLLDETSVQRLRLSSLNCEDITDELLDLFATDSRLCRHFHIPLQAGEDGTLSAMNRDYSISDFKAVIQGIIDKLGNVGLGSDVIVGFPGESDEQFEKTVLFVESLPFTYLHVFPYSIRPGTVAAGMKGHIPATVKNERARRLRTLARDKKLAFNASFVGKTLSVLFEGRNLDGRISGFTSEYTRVSVPFRESLVNEIVKVSIEEMVDDVLWGSVMK